MLAELNKRAKTPVRRCGAGFRGVGGLQGRTRPALRWLDAVGGTQGACLPVAKAGQQRGLARPKDREDGGNLPCVPRRPRRGAEPIPGARCASQGDGAGEPGAAPEPRSARHRPNSPPPGERAGPWTEHLGHWHQQPLSLRSAGGCPAEERPARDRRCRPPVGCPPKPESVGQRLPPGRV